MCFRQLQETIGDWSPAARVQNLEMELVIGLLTESGFELWTDFGKDFEDFEDFENFEEDLETDLRWSLAGLRPA